MSPAVYRKIFSLAHGYWTFPFLLLSLAAQQGAQVVGSYALVWWQEDAFNQPMGFCKSFCRSKYPFRRLTSSCADEGIYAMLGVLQAVFSFLMGEPAAPQAKCFRR